MKPPKTVFVCQQCGDEHRTKDVECLDIHESFQGFDVLTFVCPNTGEKTEAYVYSKR